MQDYIFPKELSTQVRNDPKLRAEVEVYDLLKEQIKTKNLDLIVIYDASSTTELYDKEIKQKQNSNFKDAQSDFIIFNRKYGIVNFEIKGGLVSRDKNGVWHGRSRDGKTFVYERSPIDQTQSNKWKLQHLVYEKLEEFGLSEKIKEQKKLQHFNRYSYPLNFMHALSLPDTPSSKELFEQANADKKFIFTKENNDQLAEKLLYLLQSKIVEGHPESYVEPQAEVLNTLKRLFTQEINLEEEKSFHFKIIQDKAAELEDLISEKVFENKQNKNQMVVGGAGSGKTLMAIYKMVHLLKENRENNILYLTSNLALTYDVDNKLNSAYKREIFTQEEKEKELYAPLCATPLTFLDHAIKIDTQGLEIISREEAIELNKTNFDGKRKDFHAIGSYKEGKLVFLKVSSEWMSKNIFSNYQVAWATSQLPLFCSQNILNLDLTENTLEHALEFEDKNKFDYIFVDEAQDFSAEYLEAISLFLKNPDEGFFIFMDDNQSLSKRKKQSKGILEKFKEFPRLDLTNNFRNTKKIHKLSSGFYEGSTKKSLGLDGMDIEFITANSPYEVQQATINSLKDLESLDLNIAILQGDITKEQNFSLTRNGTGLYLVLDEIKKQDLESELYTSYPFKNNDFDKIKNINFDDLKSLSDFIQPFSAFRSDRNLIPNTHLMLENLKKAEIEGLSLSEIEELTSYEIDIPFSLATIGGFKVAPSNDFIDRRKTPTLTNLIYQDDTHLNLAAEPLHSGEAGSKNIHYDYISNFKGREADVVILVNLDQSMDIVEDLYVGLSRAKSQLIVISGEASIHKLKQLS